MKLLLLSFLLYLGSPGVFALSIQDLPDIPQDGELWVLLVAGSNGWYNYRHQADVCHAYQIVHAHGVPDDHIVVMMYDDIAYNKENPTPGKVINHPNGPDVYHGVPKDYTCQNVRPDLFLQVLQGEKIDSAFGSGKSINSGPNDHVFVYFADHGAKGLVGFGENVLKATDLNEAIIKMHKANKYSKMVFYVEACESGSMFKNLLPEHVNVFATTASNSTTSSYACYFDKERKTFLGDVYSIKWLEDSDKENIEKETLEHQFIVVKNETNTSTVCQFGEKEISQMPVGAFQGPKENVIIDIPPPTPNYPPSWYSCGRDAVPGPEVPVKILQNNIASATNPQEAQEAREKYIQLMNNRKFMEDKVKTVISTVTNNEDDTNTMFTDNKELTEYDCYYAVVDEFHNRCFNLGLNDYALRMLNPFVNLCQKNYDVNIILDAIKAECNHPAIHGIH